MNIKMTLRSRTPQRDIYKGPSRIATAVQLRTGRTLQRPDIRGAVISTRPDMSSILSPAATRSAARIVSAGGVRSLTPTAAVGTIGLRGPTTSGLMSQPQDTPTTPTLSLGSVSSGISSTLGSVGSGVMNTIQSLIPIAIKLILLYIGVKVVLWLIRGRRR